MRCGDFDLPWELLDGVGHDIGPESTALSDEGSRAQDVLESTGQSRADEVHRDRQLFLQCDLLADHEAFDPRAADTPNWIARVQGRPKRCPFLQRSRTAARLNTVGKEIDPEDVVTRNHTDRVVGGDLDVVGGDASDRPFVPALLEIATDLRSDAPGGHQCHRLVDRHRRHETCANVVHACHDERRRVGPRWN